MLMAWAAGFRGVLNSPSLPFLLFWFYVQPTFRSPGRGERHGVPTHVSFPSPYLHSRIHPQGQDPLLSAILNPCPTPIPEAECVWHLKA